MAFSLILKNQNHMNKNFVNTDSLLQGPLGFHFKAQLLPYCVKKKNQRKESKREKKIEPHFID